MQVRSGRLCAERAEMQGELDGLVAATLSRDMSRAGSTVRSFIAACAAAVIGLAPQIARAENAKFGSAAIFTDRPCTAPLGTACRTQGVPTTIVYAGGANGGISPITTNYGDGLGSTASARVVFGQGYLPTIGVASAAGTTRTGASVTTYRSFTYTGDDAIDLALNGQLHYVTSGDTGSATVQQGGLDVVWGILRLSDIASFNSSTTAGDIISWNSAFPDCSEGAIAATAYQSSGQAAGTHTATLGLSSTCGGAPITLNKGDSFVIVATLQAITNRGGLLDAMSTFSVEYDQAHTYLAGTTNVVDPSVFRSIQSPVPEPTGWALMIGGFGLAGAALRRRRPAVIA